MKGADYSLARLDDFVGVELGVSEWMPVEQDRIDAFAACTGDDQWIHVDPDRARRESPLGSTIAHGYLLLALVAKFKLEVGAVPDDAAYALNYGLDKVRFLAPVRTGSRIRGRVRITGVEHKGPARSLARMEVTVEIEGEQKPALVADTLVLLSGAEQR